MYVTAMHLYLNMHIHELYCQQPSEAIDCLGRTTYYNEILCVILVILFTYLVFSKIVSVFTLYLHSLLLCTEHHLLFSNSRAYHSLVVI